MPVHITTDHIYDVGTGTVIEFTESLLFCINGVYYTSSPWVWRDEDFTPVLRLDKADDRDMKGHNPQALVDANVAVEE